MLMILNDAYNLHLIILPRMAGAILGFLRHLGESLFGHISSRVSTLVSAKVGVWERRFNITLKKKFYFLLGQLKLERMERREAKRSEKEEIMCKTSQITISLPTH